MGRHQGANRAECFYEKIRAPATRPAACFARRPNTAPEGTVKRFANVVLKVFALGIPMLIAACYGMPARYSRTGKVVDADTHDLLSDIKINCVDGSGAVTDYTNSYDGNWTLYYDEPCDHLTAEDTQSPARYQNQTVSFPSGDGSTINMTKVQ